MFIESVTQPNITGCAVGFKSGTLGLLTQFTICIELQSDVIN